MLHVPRIPESRQPQRAQFIGEVVHESTKLLAPSTIGHGLRNLAEHSWPGSPVDRSLTVAKTTAHRPRLSATFGRPDAPTMSWDRAVHHIPAGTTHYFAPLPNPALGRSSGAGKPAPACGRRPEGAVLGRAHRSRSASGIVQRARLTPASSVSSWVLSQDSSMIIGLVPSTASSSARTRTEPPVGFIGPTSGGALARIAIGPDP